MVLCVWYWRAAAIVTGVGIALAAINFRPDNPSFLLGLALSLVGVIIANTGYIAMRSRSMDEEFDAGYRVGYRAGRRTPRIEKVTPIMRASEGLSAFNKAVQHGGVQKAPVGALAGHDTSAGRPEAYTH
jgi:hypothetical protein